MIKRIQDIMSNPLFEVSKADIWSRLQRRARILDSPGAGIPCTSTFEICLESFNIILDLIGLPRRLPNTMFFRPHQNKSMNRYMERMVMRMNKALKEGQPRKFGFIAQFCMKRSVSFRVSAINRVFHNGYKLMPLSFVININQKADKIILKGLDELEFKRVYIPKDPNLFREMRDREKYVAAGGKGRPLGVPKHAGRLVLHMWNNFLTMFLSDYLGENQHAYRPRRGAVTAGKDVFSKIDKYDYIYEIDLKQCFPSIQAQYITDILMKLGMPPAPVYGIENINRCTPKFQSEDLVDESQLRDKALFRNLGKVGKEQPKSILDPGLEMEPENQMVVWTMITEDTGVQAPVPGTHFDDYTFDQQAAVYEFIQLQGALLDQYTPSTVGSAHTNIPQGSNISPILTAMVLRDFTNQLPSVFYADDGIFFSNAPIRIENDPDKGIFVHPEKSAIVKENGIGLKELKFLGMKYNPFTDTISGHTRNGSRLEFDKKREDIHTLLSFLAPANGSVGESKWERLFRSTLSGQVVAKLYNSTGEELEYIIRGKPFGVVKSWLALKGLTDNFKTTSSDACCALSYIIRSKCGHVKKSYTASDDLAAVEKVFRRESWRAFKINGRWIRVKTRGKNPLKE